MLVQCYVTGEFGDSSVFYKNGDRWFKSELIYRMWRRNNNYKEECFKIIADLIDIPYDARFPDVVYDKLNSYKTYGYKEVYKILCNQYDWLKKHFRMYSPKSDYGAACYIMTVLDNQLKKKSMRAK